MAQPHEHAHKSRLRLLIAIGAFAIVVLLLAVGVLTWQLTSSRDQGTAGATTSSAPSTTQPFIRDDLKVSAGEGGSSVSPIDGVTPIGYQPTCKGAVEAATNYVVALDASRPRDDAQNLSDDQFLQLLEDRTSGDGGKEMVDATRAAFTANPDARGPAAKQLPQLGGFSVNKCEPGKSAEIYIVYATTLDDATYSYYPVSVSLAWVDDDWKMTALGTFTPPTELPTNHAGEDPGVREDLGLQSQWENYQDGAS